MGKTPGKWIKTLLGKRSSKSNVLKEKDVLNSENRGEDLIPSKRTPTEKAVAANPPLSSLPVSGTISVNEIDLVNTVPLEVPGSADDVSSRNGCDVQMAVCISSLEESEQVRMQEAAKKAQAAFRGYLARRAFRTLKGIVRLQAVIRGHLVRRQAVATLFCLQGIVKFQILIRRRKGSKPSIPANKCSQKLWRNVFIRKLLAPSPARALHLQYSPDDPNCEWEWLQRWTRLRFWQPISQQKKLSDSKSQMKHGNAEIDNGRPKRSVRKLPSSNSEMGSPRSSFQSVKVKRNTGKISSSMAGSAEERSRVEAEKSKPNGRKTRVIANGVPDLVESENKTLRQSSGKVHGVTASDAVHEEISDFAEVYDMGSDDATPNGAPGTVDRLNISESNGSAEKEKGLKHDDGSVNMEDNKKSSRRRASLPVKIEQPEAVTPSMTKVPSYMAPTQSAKAKLRGQGSPRFVEDDAVTNGVVRRHSLPSSINGKVASHSPQAHRMVEASGNGAAKNDKSLTSSRDVGEKGIKAEWKR